MAATYTCMCGVVSRSFAEHRRHRVSEGDSAFVVAFAELGDHQYALAAYELEWRYHKVASRA